MRYVAIKLDTLQFGWFLVVCWTLWNSRNAKLMEDTHDDPLSLIQQARRFIDAFWEADVVIGIVEKTSSPAIWRPPPRGWVKINFDVGISKEQVVGSVGIIARNEEGSCIGWRAMCFPGITDPMHIEAVAARLAVELALASVWENVVIERDCSGVIHPLECGLIEPSQINPVLLETHVMGSSIQRLEWSLVRSLLMYLHIT
ncbi:hypothetical protein Salat_2818000 [Sesamum alatum]|uniref:RNase H type-1 domain-containing protein n=1 Tax=Sesamum alatum TaxID=300844 RepID=A0AAE1XLG8_9LAMI|nr:hypothetical protein Salat_2818000 [Sesamum alatum]